MLNVVMKSVIMLNVVMQSVVMLNVIILSVIMLNFFYTECRGAPFTVFLQQFKSPIH